MDLYRLNLYALHTRCCQGTPYATTFANDFRDFDRNDKIDTRKPACQEPHHTAIVVHFLTVRAIALGLY